MKNKIVLVFVIMSTISINCTKPDPVIVPTKPDTIVLTDYDVVLNGNIVSATGFGMGIDDELHLQNWMKVDTTMALKYPGSLSWGSVFITVNGDPVKTNKHWIDISACTKLSIEMRGDLGGEAVKIGIKDKDDPDNGTETKQTVNLTKDWTVYNLQLSDFKTCDLSKVYVVTEFVFPATASNSAANVYVKNIRILK